MKNEAKVISVDGEFAVVEVQRVSACEGCHKYEEGKGCSVCTLMGGDRSFSAKASNSIGAKVGDRVFIESRTTRVMLYACLVFILPIAVSILGYAIASCITVSAAWRVAGAFIGLCLTFMGLFFYSRALSKKRCDVEITEIIVNKTYQTNQQAFGESKKETE